MGIPIPDIEKFIPLWACAGIVGFGLTAIVALLIVLATSHRDRELQ